MKTVYLVVGCPGSGKTWVCEQLRDKFHYVPHDAYDEKVYPQILHAATRDMEPVLGEIPFGLSKIHQSLSHHGVRVVPVFIIENEQTLQDRYRQREGRDIITGHLTRQKTYAQRARELGAFCGTAKEVLEHLKGAVS